jgi:hypothetical protein
MTSSSRVAWENTRSGAVRRCNSKRPLAHLLDHSERQAFMDTTCSVDGCNRPFQTRGYCGMHYQRIRKQGSPGSATTHRMRGRTCSVDGCERKSDSHGMCAMHRQRALKGGELGPVGTLRYGGPCTAGGCDRPASALKLCAAHYAQQAAGRPFGPIREVWFDRATTRDERGNKQCRGCRQWLPESAYTRARRSKDGLTRYCRPCRKDQALQTNYGITLEQYEKLLASQGGVCAICGAAEADGRSLHVDHDHKCCAERRSCGRCVRGLLCSPCNTGIGMLGEDAKRLWSAMMYLAGGTP